MQPDAPTLTIARLSRLLESHVPADLTLPQYRVLGLLAGGDERASQLAARLAVAKPTLTAIIDSLVDRGFVVRETESGDRRVVSLSITAAGTAALRGTETELNHVLDDLLGRCAHPDVVVASLDELRQALNDRWADRSREQVAAARKGATR